MIVICSLIGVKTGGPVAFSIQEYHTDAYQLRIYPSAASDQLIKGVTKCFYLTHTGEALICLSVNEDGLSVVNFRVSV